MIIKETFLRQSTSKRKQYFIGVLGSGKKIGKSKRVINLFTVGIHNIQSVRQTVFPNVLTSVYPLSIFVDIEYPLVLISL